MRSPDEYELWMINLDKDNRFTTNMRKPGQRLGRCRNQTHGALHGHDLWHGQGRILPLHDPIVRKNVLHVAQRQNREVLSFAHRGGMGYACKAGTSFWLTVSETAFPLVRPLLAYGQQ